MYNYRKYKAQKTELCGELFDSKGEARRWQELVLLEKAGEIKDLRRQVPFELIPVQRQDGKVVERAARYIADFVYKEDGETVVEDFKGVRTPEYILKRKLMLYFFGVRIRETGRRRK